MSCLRSACKSHSFVTVLRRGWRGWQGACWNALYAALPMIFRAVPRRPPREAGADAPRSLGGGVTHAPRRRLAIPNPRAGGTLVELAVAVCILALAGGAIVTSVNYGMFMIRLTRENARATQVLLEKAQTLRMYNWDQVVYSNGLVPSTFTAVYDPQAPTGQQGVVYYGTITNTAVPFQASYSNKMRACTIGLRWTTEGRIHHTRTLTTYIAADGVRNYVW